MRDDAKRMYEAAKSLKSIDSQADLARFLDVSAQTLHNWEQRGISRRGVLLLHTKLGASTEWLEHGVGDMSASKIDSLSYDNEYVDIPRLFVGNHRSQMHGVEQPVMDYLRLSRTYTGQRFPLTVASLRFVTANDAMMSPTFLAGDVLIVDVSHTSINQNGVYVFLDADQNVHVARFTRTLNADYQITYDNDTIKSTYILSNQQITIVARVVCYVRFIHVDDG
mgnify:FL=1